MLASIFFTVRLWLHRLIVLPPMFVVALVFLICAAWDRIISIILQVPAQFD